MLYISNIVNSTANVGQGQYSDLRHRQTDQLLFIVDASVVT